jgi:hypothetical protein
MKEYYITWKINNVVKKKKIKGIPLLKLSRECGFDMFYHRDHRGFVITDKLSGTQITRSLYFNDAKDYVFRLLKKYGKQGLIKEVKSKRVPYPALGDLVECTKEERFD